MARPFGFMALSAVWLTLACGCSPKSGEASAPPAKPANAPGLPGRPVDPAVDPAARVALEVAALPESPLAGMPGLETAEGWKLADWGDPGQLKSFTVGAAKRTLLRLYSAGGPNAKSAAVLTRNLVLAEKGSADVAVYNPGASPVQVAAAFWFADEWVYYESTPREVPPKTWKVLSFDLAAGDYKTKSNGWQHAASLWKREDAKQLALLLIGDGRPAAIYFEGLRVPEGKVPVRPPAARPEAYRPKPEPKPEPPKPGAVKPEPAPAVPEAPQPNP